MNIKIGLTTRCNARCPLCMRTKYPPKIQDIDIDHLKTIPNIELVSLVSGDGEPTLYPKFFEALGILRDVTKKIKIHTNGSTHNEIWWESLANGLRQDDVVVFPLDGLEDTYSKYRVGLNFKKTIKNIEAFTRAGGNAQCDTLMFKHIEHQMVEIEKLAKDIGCKTFKKKVSWYYTDEFERPGTFCLGEQEPFCYLSNEIVMDTTGRYWPCVFIQSEIRKYEKSSLNESFILRIKYHKSKDKMFTLEDALQTPLFKYVKENIFKLDVCKVCASTECQRYV